MSATHVLNPGNKVTDLIDGLNESNKPAKLGPGLYCKGEDVFACKSGILRYKKPNLFWINCHQKRYTPCKNDNVVGVVTQKQGDNYRVEIGTSDHAVISYLSFDGSSKRNRPNINVGDTLFAEVIVANKHMEPEITCVDTASGKARGKGVITSNNGFTYSAKVSLNLARKVVSHNCNLLMEIGKRFPFEVYAGMNGVIVISARTSKQVLIILNLIKSSEYLSNAEIVSVLNASFL